jgi:hypothetical protein
MTWVLIGVLIWVAVAIPAALLIGRGIRLADAKRSVAASGVTEANFVATDVPPADIPTAYIPPAYEAPEEPAAQPWTGPSTVPFAPSRLPWGGDRSSTSRPRPPVVRHVVRPVERDPNARDSGLN